MPTRSAPIGKLRVDSVVLEVGAVAIGRTLVGLALRQKTGAIAFALERAGVPIQEGLPDLELAEGDILHLAGSEVSLVAATALLVRPRTSADAVPA